MLKSHFFSSAWSRNIRNLETLLLILHDQLWFLTLGEWFSSVTTASLLLTVKLLEPEGSVAEGGAVGLATHSPHLARQAHHGGLDVEKSKIYWFRFISVTIVRTILNLCNNIIRKYFYKKKYFYYQNLSWPVPPCCCFLRKFYFVEKFAE